MGPDMRWGRKSMSENAPGETRLRPYLAIVIVGLSVLLIAVASAVAILAATDTGRPEMSRLVFASVLPLLGTWVGTVLAFYFARENLQAATASTMQLTRRIEPTTPVNQVMVSRAQIVSYDLPAGVDVKTVRLFDLRNKMKVSGKNRLPILDNSGAILYILHDSTIAAFALKVTKDPTDQTAFTETMDNLLQDAELKKAVEAIAIAGPEADVAEARIKMRSVEGCNDVFVTARGQKADPVIGWLTNTDLATVE
jgi:hypothetical protein